MDEYQRLTPTDEIHRIREELRARLGLPDWSNIRGDDVISRVEALDPDSRAQVNDLFVRLRELEDERVQPRSEGE